jgi:drug/metabolite transporter (DMT)-like permease
MPLPTDRRTLAAFIAMSVFAGANGVAVRFSNRELEPFWGASFRFFAATALALMIVRSRGLSLPKGRALAGPVLYGAFAIGGAFAFIYLGFLDIRAGLGQTVIALVPLVTLLLAVAVRQEVFRVSALAGTVLAVAGIATVSRSGINGEAPLGSLLLLVLAAFCFAAATVVVRMFEPVDPMLMTAVGLPVGAAIHLALSLLAGESFELPTRAATWVAIAYVATIGSVGVFALYVVVVQGWNASRASYSFVVMPLVAVVLSWWLDDERIGWELVLGGLLVLAGVYLGALRPARATTSAAAAGHEIAHRPG